MSSATFPASQNTQGGPQQNDDVADWLSRVKDAAATPATITAPKQGEKWHESFFGCFTPVDIC